MPRETIEQSLPIRKNLSGLISGKKDSLSAKIIRNVVASGLRSVLVAPVPFIMTPIILHKIGTGGYGTWAVFLAISGLTSLADLGMVGTLGKHVAEYYARKDFEALNRLLSTGLVIFVLLALVLSVSLWLGSSLVPAFLFRGSPLQGAELVVLLRFYLIVIGANILTLLFASVASGLQRLDLVNWISAANIYCAAAVSLILLFRGWGLRGLVCGQICAALLSLAAYVVTLRKLLPKAGFSAWNVDLDEARKMFSFSLRLYVTQAAVVIQNQVEKFLLALFAGVAGAGWYDIASDAALKIRALIALVLGPVLPAASELDALQDEKRLEDLYFRAQKYLAFFGMPIVCYVAAVSKRFVELWVGPKLAFLGFPLAVLVAVNFYNLATGPGFLIFAGRGRLRPGMQSALVGIIVNVFLSAGLIYRFGFPGAVFGTATSLVSASTYFLYLFHRDTRYSVLRLLREAYLKPMVISLPLGAAVFLAVRELAASWTGLVALGIGFGIFYVTALLFSRFFDRYDWSKIEGLLPAVRRARETIGLA
jgi:O-antigen/teichoic acid export membrane protein